MATIIVAEDDADTRKMYVEQAALFGARVIAVDSGEALVEAFINHDIYAVIADYGLIGIDGIEATRRIRAYEHGLRPHGPQVPILMVSGSDVKKKALEAGATEFHLKPNGTQTALESLARREEFAAYANTTDGLYLQTKHL